MNIAQQVTDDMVAEALDAKASMSKLHCYLYSTEKCRCGEEWTDAHWMRFILERALSRAEWEAEQGEVEWEYATEASEDVRTVSRPRGPRIIFDGVPYPPETIARFVHGRRIRRRKAGPWLPVEEGETP